MWNIWNAFVGLLESVLLAFYTFFQGFAPSQAAGLAIILFTVVARLVILPLTLTSIRSTRRMQELQPQLKELQRKHGKDSQKLTEETMKLYREYKVNPAGSCLPMVFQFPIFIGVYQAVIHLANTSPASEAARGALQVLGQNSYNVGTAMQTLSDHRLAGGFLWLADLGVPDRLYILPVLSIVFQLLVQLMATPRVQDPQQKAMMQSMLVMPLIFGYIGFTFPSGAVLYWVVGSVLSMTQQYVIAGWGSLANYLKFLPADRGLFPPATATPVLATAQGSLSGTDVPVEDGQKLSFWDVLRPVADQPDSDSERGEDTNAGAPQDNRRRSLEQMNSRRRRPRRS